MTPLPAPNYSVELIAENNKHNYKVTWGCGPQHLDPQSSVIYPGVTGVLSVIAKPALVPWAKRVTLDKVREELKHMIWKADATGYVRPTLEGIDALLERASKIPDKLKDDAAKLGTEAHAYIDKIVRGETPGPLPDEILEPVSGFAKWWKESGFEFVAGDTKVASRIHGYGGSLDALARRPNGQIVLLDWKTSKALYDEYALQVSAYVKAFEEMYGLTISEAWCVRFRKAGVDGPPFEALPVRSISESFLAFLSAKSLQESLKNEHFIRPEKPKKEKKK